MNQVGVNKNFFIFLIVCNIKVYILDYVEFDGIFQCLALRNRTTNRNKKESIENPTMALNIGSETSPPKSNEKMSILGTFSIVVRHICTYYNMYTE